jgi:hypothetical protein
MNDARYDLKAVARLNAGKVNPESDAEESVRGEFRKGTYFIQIDHGLLLDGGGLGNQFALKPGLPEIMH